ncbi:MAG: hypothetical protein Q9172_005439 [Xanthocarpia lactea]
MAVEVFLNPDDAFEEGEIGKEHDADGSTAQRLLLAPTERDRFTQSLHSIKPFTEHLFTREAYVFDLLGAANPPPPTCPYCRQPAGLGQWDNYADVVQLIRTRLRLTNLAYQILRFSQTQQGHQGMHIQKFLHRRSEDNKVLAMEDAFLYLNQKQLRKTEQLRIIRLIALFENFRLKSKDLEFFFGT